MNQQMNTKDNLIDTIPTFLAKPPLMKVSPSILKYTYLSTALTNRLGGRVGHLQKYSPMAADDVAWMARRW